MSKKDKFPHLREFLKVEKAALEYNTSELKIKRKQVNIHAIESSVSETNCLIHGNVGHNRKDCRQYKNFNITDSYACYGCLCPGHQVKECAKRAMWQWLR